MPDLVAMLRRIFPPSPPVQREHKLVLDRLDQHEKALRRLERQRVRLMAVDAVIDANRAGERH